MWFQLSIICIWVCLKIAYPYTQWLMGNIPYFQTNPNISGSYPRTKLQLLVSLAGFFHQEAATIALHQGFEKGVGIEPWTEPHFSRPEPHLCRGKTGARRFLREVVRRQLFFEMLR